MIDVVLTRLQSSHQNLRSDEIEGTAPSLPQVGKNFILFGDPLAKGAIARLVATTPVKRIEPDPDNGSMEFWTANSHYGLQVVDMDTVGGTH